MDAVKSKLRRDVVPEFPSSSPRDRCADKDFAIGKSDHVCRPLHGEELPVNTCHRPFADDCAINVVEPGEGASKIPRDLHTERERPQHQRLKKGVIVGNRALSGSNKQGGLVRRLAKLRSINQRCSPHRKSRRGP